MVLYSFSSFVHFEIILIGTSVPILCTFYFSSLWRSGIKVKLAAVQVTDVNKKKETQRVRNHPLLCSA